jgi:L-ascorbate metabolism protein UlaG (beta-lactamase superfamily)
MLIMLTALSVFAQRPAPDKIETENGTLTIQPVMHGTLVLSWNGASVYVDPFGGAKAFEGLEAPDLILITDVHGDHLNEETLNALETKGATLVVPDAVAERLPEIYQDQLVVIGNGEQTEQMGITIRAVPMYNLPESEDSRHTKGRGNGYVLTMGGKNVYVSGDTEDIPEMRALEDIDVAFVCMNLPYTMDVNQAASAVLEFQPDIVYPYHYRGQDTGEFKRLVNAKNGDIEVRLRDWYPED